MAQKSGRHCNEGRDKQTTVHHDMAQRNRSKRYTVWEVSIIHPAFFRPGRLSLGPESYATVTLAKVLVQVSVEYRSEDDGSNVTVEQLEGPGWKL